ncbi:MAG: ABC transporter permease [Planctomycetota bacterium]|nr:ABC transporter permease [Planctomycetota bacterium]MDG2143744.1 ABC transporter permease [Planctomycetota bacterium]
MRAIFMIALREYAENAKTKGFWIGLFLFPVIIFASIAVQRLLEDSTPTRHFVLVDQSGAYGAEIREDIDRAYRSSVLMALNGYALEHAVNPPQAKEIDLEETPPIDMAEMQQSIESHMGPEMGAMLDEEGIESMLELMSAPFDGLVEDRPEFEMPRPAFLEVPLPKELNEDASVEELSEQLRPYLRGEKTVIVDGEEVSLFACVLLPRDIQDFVQRPGLLADLKRAKALQDKVDAGPDAKPVRRGGQYWGSNLADSDLKNRIQRSINKTLQRRELETRGLDVAAVAAVNDTTLRLSALDPKKEEGKEEVSTADQIRQWAPVGFVYLLWIGIFTISQMLLNNTVEEKSNRIIEVLLSSVTAGELMMGKLAGIAGIGLTMIGVWMGSLVGILGLSAGPEAEFPTMLLEVLTGSGLIFWFVLYFCLGYLLYAGIFLAIGSLCNTIKDAQNLMGPVMLIMMVPIITMMFIPKDPNGTLATILSWIPLYTPFTMMNRAAADPPMFDKIGTLVLLVVFTLFTLVMVGRVFRAGILRTGQPPKIRELLSWMKP